MWRPVVLVIPKPPRRPAGHRFFPYAGLLRPVVLHSVPATAHIDDVTVATLFDGRTGVVNLRISAAGNYSGKGNARLGNVEADVTFRGGAAEVTLRVPDARLWSPADPHLTRRP